MGSTSSAEIAQDEAVQYLSELIQAHLVATMQHLNGQGSTSPQNISTSRNELVFGTLCFIVFFESNNDYVLASLLRGLEQAQESADEATTEAIQAVLRRTVEITPPQRQEDGELGTHTDLGSIPQFFQSVLEDLLRRGENDESDDVDNENDESDDADNENDESDDMDDKTDESDYMDDETDESDDVDEDDKMEESMTSSDPFSSLSTSPVIKLSMGKTALDVRFDELLSLLWTTGEIDTNCHACANPFVNEPPIRTFRNIQESEEMTPHVRIINRHFSCLKEGKHAFVPISHVWHDSIREANNLANKHAGPKREATKTILSTLETLFESAEDAYLPEVEFWHDYVSVPQWESETKKALLHWLPAIYHLADEILVHVGDMPNQFIQTLLRTHWTGPPQTVQDAIDRILPLRTLCSSEWMQRMWVTLEYSQCKAACIMSEDNHIVRDPDEFGNSLLSRDTFTHLIRASHNQLNELFRFASTFCDSLSLPGDFLGGLTEHKVQGAELKRFCLGEAFELVNRKRCFEEADRFLAIYLLLNPESAPTNRPEIPKDPSKACFFLWRYALRQGDYSPLLLQPKELESSSNPGFEIPSWAVGWGGLAKGEWRLGDQKLGPLRSSISVDEADTVELELDVIGQITTIHYLSDEDCGNLSGIEWTLRLLISIAQGEQQVLSPQTLLDGLNSVFPLDMMHSELHSQVTFSIPSNDLLDGRIVDRLRAKLEKIGSVGDSTVANQDLSQLAKDVAEILQFERQLLERHSTNVTRLNRSRVLAERRMKRGAKGGEPICEVMCPDCRKSTLLRLDLRDNAAIGDTVYRIPGLSYAETLKGGVGLVVSGGRITGRMLYGPPTCTCQGVLVELR